METKNTHEIAPCVRDSRRPRRTGGLFPSKCSRNPLTHKLVCNVKVKNGSLPPSSQCLNEAA